MERFLLAALGLLAVGGIYALWRASRRGRDAGADAEATREATARFEAIRQSNPSMTSAQAPFDEEPKVDGAELLNRLFACALDRENDKDVRTAAHGAIEEAVVATLTDLANQPKHLPRRPQLLPQLLQAVNDDGASLRGIARLIARDPALTGNLLRIANSPAYRMQPAPIESIERAVAVLGTHGIRSTIAAAVLQPVLSSGGAFAPLPEVIWEHSMRAASAAESHAMLIGNDDPFAAQLLGLLHGLGAIAIFRIARDEFAEHPQVQPSAALITRLIDQYAAPTAARIAASWELSERVVEALSEQQSDVGEGGRRRSALGQALHFGQITATLALLVDAARITPEEARGLLPDGRRHGLQVDRIWERLMRNSRAVRDASMLIKT
jgi:HD-like signal output (HDOD) protein